MKEIRLPISSINLDDRRFSFSRGGDLEPLLSSIRAVGILNPPILLREGLTWAVISGRRRIQALRRLRRRKVEARFAESTELSPFRAWEMNFFDNYSHRVLNAAEACTAVEQLYSLDIPPERIVRHFLPLFGLPPRLPVVDNCRKVAALEERILDRLAKGGITLSTAAFLSTLAPVDRKKAFRFLSTFPLSVSSQREWVRLLSDLSQRDGKSATAILSSARRAASSAGRHGRPGDAVVQVLREKRYPSLSARRRSWRAMAASLSLPSTFQLSPHPFFEKEELTFRFTVRSDTELRQAIARLEKLPSAPGFESLLPLEGSRRKRK